MTLSRTARILIAMLLLAAAAFFWVNFFSQAPATTNLLGNVEPAGNGAPLTVAPSRPGAAALANGEATPPAAGGSPTTAGPTTATPTATPSGAGGSPTTAGPTATPSEAAGDLAAPTPAAAGSPAATAVGPQGSPAAGDTPTVAAPDGPNVATRDVHVSELPFLVTEPPAPTPADVETEANAAGATRPQSGQRATVNPFSPILVQAQTASAPAAPPSAAPAPEVAGAENIIITDSAAPGPGAVAAPAQLVKAPAPRPLAPASSQTAALPRALPSGTLPVTPGILRSVRTAPVASAPEDLGHLAAVREPEGRALATDSFARAGTDPSSLDSPTTLQPLGTAQARADAEPSSSDQPPLLVGANALSRYLRDNNVRFTGAVLGPVNVGVFRSAVYTAPVVLSLGQSLPDTSIVLTDIRGHEAQFSQDDTTQSLSLDLRR